MEDEKKLEILYQLKKSFEQKALSQDSVYALLLHRIGYYEYATRQYQLAINSTLLSIRVNESGRANCSKSFALNSYFNMGYYYDKLHFFEKAFEYYDSTIIMAKSLPGNEDFIGDARVEKAYLFFRKGDYQKSIEESDMGIASALARKDTSQYVSFLNQKSQALFYQNKANEALADLNIAISLSKLHGYIFQLASAYKTAAFIYTEKRDFGLAESLFLKCISNRISIKNNLADQGQISDDYNDLGIFYRDSLRSFSRAEKIFLSGINWSAVIKDSVRLTRLYLNYGIACYNKFDYKKARTFYDSSLSYILPGIKNPEKNLSTGKLSFFGNKDLVLILFKYKTALLFTLYKQEKDRQYFDSAIKSAFFTDSLFTQMRHELFGEGSKLYWRQRSNEFYENVINNCYTAGSPDLSFFFMEKSRAVLLNDRINELNADKYLSKKDAALKENLQLSLIALQQNLLSLNTGQKEYKDLEFRFLQEKETYDHFNRSIDAKNPLYYQYKYDDKVPSLKDLQQYLFQNKQNFIHYFISDSAVYILSISATTTRMIKHSRKNYGDTLSAFVRLCSNRQTLNSNTGYHYFSKTSNAIYQTLFKELNLQPGRVIICPDNFLIPFEALCTDEKGENFLADQYAFSYIYSANFLLKKFKNSSGNGNFLGLAPVNFSASQLPTLTGSDKCLQTASEYYAGTKLLTGKSATKKNFISMLPYYEIVNIFSHAAADSTDSEPELFMYDSSLRLSELQKIYNPATRLVVLSACETGAGKKATGEGIYSLARGFAAAGVPSVAATIWKADDQAIYEITRVFHENISKGLPLDLALQQSKKIYLKSGSSERTLPYFWANMIIVGNAEPVVLSKDNYVGWWISGGIILIAAAGFVWAKRKPKKAA